MTRRDFLRASAAGLLPWQLGRATPVQQMLLGGGNSSFNTAPTFNTPMTSTLVPTTATGSAAFSFGRSAAATVQDWENVLRFGISNEVRFVGARRVQNLIAGSSVNLTNVNWGKINGGTGSAPTTTANFATDPLGGSTASRLQVNKGAGGTSGDYSVVRNQVTGLKGAYVFSVYLKSNSGTPTVNIYLSDNTLGVTASTSFAITNGWVRYSIFSSGSGDGSPYAALGLVGSFGGSASADVLVWGAQMELVSGQSNQNPGEYVSVGVLSSPYNGANVDAVKYFSTLCGNTVASNVVTEATGAAITSSNGSALTTDATGPRGLLIEEARTNAFTGSQIFSGWTASNCSVANGITASPSGIVDGVSLTETATSNVDRAVAFTTSKAASVIQYTMSVFIKKGGRNWAFLAINDGTNSCNAFFNVNTGVVGSTAGAVITVQSSSMQAAANGFYRCTMTFTTTAATGLTAFVGSAPSDGSSVGAGLNALAIYIWGPVLEQGAFATSYTSAASRDYDGFSYGTFAANADATVGTVYVEASTLWATAAAAYPLIAFGTATNYPLYSASEAATVIRTNDGTNNVSKTGLTSMATGVRKRAASWTGATLAVAGDGVAAATGTFDGNMGSTAIGVGNPTTGTGVVWNGTIRNLKLWAGAAATASQLATLTT